MPVRMAEFLAWLGLIRILKAIFDVVQLEKVLAIFPTVAEAKSAIKSGPGAAIHGG